MEYIKLILQQLSNRELAIIIWGILLFTLTMTLLPSVRKSFWVVIKTLFSRKILPTLIMNTLLFATLIIGTKYFQIWDNTLWKDAILWFLASFVMLFNSHEALRDKNHYKKAFLKFLKWESILIFFIALHSFSLIAELIFIPIFTFIILLQTVASLKKEFKKAENFLNIIVLSIVLVIIGFSIKESIIQPEKTFSISNLYSLIFPIALTIVYIPFLYIFSLYMIYETLFCRLKIFIKDEFTFIDKIRVVFTCGSKINNVKKFQEMAFQEYYVRSEQDLLKTINSFNRRK